MNSQLVTSALLVCVGASAALAQEAPTTATFGSSAGVALMAPEQTGFLYGAQVGVNGVGSGAVTVAEQTSVHGFVGYALSGLGENLLMQSAAGTLGTFTFDRGVTVNGSLAGLGATMAQGTATGASGFAGSAFASGQNGFTGTGETDGALTSSSSVENETAMAGSVSTSASLQLTGAEQRFAASNGTSVSESNEGFAYSALGVDPADLGVRIAPLVLGSQTNATIAAYEAFQNGDTGVAFAVDSELGNDIDLSVSNAGGGSIALSAQTGGFFNGGASGFGEVEFGGTNVGEFFRAPVQN